MANQTQTTSNWSKWIPYFFLIGLFSVLRWGPTLFESVVHNDLSQKIYIPERLTHSMNVKVAFNEKTIFFRFELPTEAPSYYHDYWVYEGEGKWRREGKSPVGPHKNRVYEDRISFFLDDGQVPEFGKWGGFVTASGKAMRFFTGAASKHEVQAHPYYGAKKKKKDVRKWLPETREDQNDWETVRSLEDLQTLKSAGYFLDLWQWRAHRSNPIGWSDDQYISDYRWSDKGKGPYTTNWNKEKNQPKYMFDPKKTDQYAMQWEKVLNQEYTQDDYLHYALILGNGKIGGNAIRFDPNHSWQKGDVIPRRILRLPGQSHGDIKANGIYRNGHWLVDLWRALDTRHPKDDKILKDRGIYQIAFAAHIRATGSRWHYVSFPMTLGLERKSDILAHRFHGSAPPWQEIPWKPIKLFYPGQIEWSHLMSSAHAGAPHIKKGVPIRMGHDEETLAQYAVESEFQSEIQRQWFHTLIALMGMIFLMSLGVFIATLRQKGAG